MTIYKRRALMNEQELYRRLANPYWYKGSLPPGIKAVPGTEGAFNIYWLLVGRPKPETLKINDELWQKAYIFSRATADGTYLEYSATVLSPEEFVMFALFHKIASVSSGGMSLTTQELANALHSSARSKSP